MATSPCVTRLKGAYGCDSDNPYTTLSDATQPQSQNRTLRNGSARLGEGATPYKNEDTGNNRVVGATPTVVYRGRVNR